MNTQTCTYTYKNEKVFIAYEDEMPNVTPIATDEFGRGAYLVEDFAKFEGDLTCSARGAVEDDGTEEIVLAECINEENDDYTEYVFCTRGEAIYNEILMQYSLKRNAHWAAHNTAAGALEELKLWAEHGIDDSGAKIIRKEANDYVASLSPMIDQLYQSDYILYDALDYEDDYCPDYDAITTHCYGLTLDEFLAKYRFEPDND